MNTNQLSTEAIEKAVIGSTLLEPEKVIVFAVNKKKVLSNSFSLQHHRIIWKTMLDMYENDIPIDTVTLSRQLEQNGKLNEIGGIVYLNSLLDATPNAAYAEYYIDVLKESQTKRRVLELTAELSQATKDNNLEECKRINSVILLEIDSHFSNTSDAEKFPAIRYNDLVAYQVPEGHIIAGKGWLRRRAGCLLTGGTSLGKSVLAEQIAVSVAAGKNILDRIHVPKPMRVTYIQAENDEETLQRDIISIVKYLNADVALVQENLAIHHLYGLSGTALENWIENQVIKQKTDLLMLDPYQNFIPSGANINDAGTFLTFIFNINRIINEHNCAFLLITHTPKPHDREQWTARESVYMAVGSQAIAAWARTSAEITGFKDDDSTYRLRFGKNAERNGITTEDGFGLVRDLMIRHSPSIHEPYWQVAESQEEPEELSEKAKKIVELAISNRALSYGDIAKQLHCSKTLVAKWYPKKEKESIYN
jgi:replicative DNA helicase